jgi:hypothetical protein
LILGAGSASTTITQTDTGYVFYNSITDTSHGGFRISGMTLQGNNVGTSVIYITSGAVNGVPTGRWRVDHINFNYTSGQRSGIHTVGVNYGLVDNTAWTWHAGIAIRQANSLGTECYPDPLPPSGALQNAQPWDVGTDKFLFVESSTFTFNWASGNSILYDASSGGGKVALRYNTVTGALFYNHWTRGCEFAAQVMEVYNNHWIGNSEWGTDEGYIASFEAGTGVVFNNFVEGYRIGVNVPYVLMSERRGQGAESSGILGACDGSKNWDGNAGDTGAPGWPCLGQIGRAPGQAWAGLEDNSVQQASAPFYFWNNGETSGCWTGGACTDTLGVSADGVYIRSTAHTINGEVDYVNSNTAMPGYSSYTYPHPLRSVTWP